MSECGKQQTPMKPTSDAAPKIVPEATEVVEELAKYLLAEDNKVNARLYCIHFNKLGLQSTYRHAWDGQETVDIYKAHPEQCRIVFMDLAMPIMGGLEASLKIREYEKENNLQPTIIVGLSASGLASEKERLIDKFGMDAVLKKPTKLETFRQFLQDWPV